jgi:HEPN domain-containing protein
VSLESARHRARLWLLQAEDDLRAARLLQAGGESAQACFLAQQVGEKALKALLMASTPLSAQRLRDLSTDLAVERRRLQFQVESLTRLQERWQREGADGERVDAAALRLQSLYTGIERCLLQIVRVLNGSTLEGTDWHRRLLDRLTLAMDLRPAVLSDDTARDLRELLAFCHLVRHRYADDLSPELVRQRLEGVLDFWPRWLLELDVFERWLVELRELAERDA